MLPSRTFPVSAIFFVGADTVKDGLMLPSRTRAVSAILADGRRETFLVNFFFILRPPVIVTEDHKRNAAAATPNNFLAIRMKMLWIAGILWKSLWPGGFREGGSDVGSVGWALIHARLGSPLDVSCPCAICSSTGANSRLKRKLVLSDEN
jgi:hypothetical protein